jgi:hypothetical protein
VSAQLHDKLLGNYARISAGVVRSRSALNRRIDGCGHAARIEIR